MILKLEAIENSKGVGIVHGNNDLVAVVFSGRSFFDNFDFLTNKAANFASRNLGWSEEATRPIIGRALSVSNLTGGRELTPDIADMVMEDPRKALQVPSGMLIREASAAPGEYFAGSFQRLYFVPTSEGEKRVDFHVLRAIDEGHRGQNVGRWMVELLLNKHEAGYYIHRSSNPMALDTNRKTPNLLQSDRIPFDKPYYTESDDGSIVNYGIEYEIARTVLAITVGEKYKLDPNGVVRGLYREQNRAYIPNPAYPETFELYQKMIQPIAEGGWGMDLPAGDTLMPIYKVK